MNIEQHDRRRIPNDGTEAVIADEFLKLGVPKEDIVLAFHSPFRRQFTGGLNHATTVAIMFTTQ